MAHKKGMGSTKNGRDSESKRLGVKRADGQKVLSPMPGTILSVNVSVGSAVKAGEVILILEAMKMENEIVAPCDGTVKQLAVQKGSTVATDALLAVVG